MDKGFVGITKESIDSEVGKPAEVVVKFVVNTEDIAAAKLFLDKVNDFVTKVNKEVEYNNIPESSRKGARYLANIIQ